MLRCLIIADDLTGAADSAAMAAAAGMRTAAVIFPPDRQLPEAALSAEVLVCDSESRDLPPAAARQKVAAVFDYFQSKCSINTIIFKKVDSTMRGCIGAELEVLLEKADPEVCLFAPALPQQGRTTLQGRQYLHGVPLEQTELAAAPKSPVFSSCIEEILQRDSSLQPALIALPQLSGSSAAVSSFIEQKRSRGQNLFICDAVQQRDLDLAAAAARRTAQRILFAGSAGLARSVFALLSPVSAPCAEKRCVLHDRAIMLTGGPFLPKNEHHWGRLLFLCGSISATARRQCSALLARTDVCGIHLDPVSCLDNPQAAAAAAAARIQAAAADKQYAAVLVSSSLYADDVSRCREAAAQRNLSFWEAGERTACALGEIMALCGSDFAGFVLTGGDTAVHACRAAGAQLLTVEGEIEPGCACCRILSGPLAGRLLISKAGSFGSEHTLLTVFQRLLSCFS